MDYEARDIRAIIIIVLTILCFFEAYTYFTSYKSETLICDREKNSCVVERITRLNKVKTAYLMDVDEVKDVRVNSHYRRHWNWITGRMRRRSYYFLVFRHINNRTERRIFSRRYRSDEQAKEKAHEIMMKLREDSNIIEVSR